MLNPSDKYEKRETVSFPSLKNDVYQAQLLDIAKKEGKAYQSEETEMNFSFEFAILNGKDADGGSARLRLLNKNFVPTYLYISQKNGKNWLYKITEAFLGRELNQAEEAEGITGEMLNSFIGKQCRVVLEKKASKKDASKFYSNISNILPADDLLEPLTDVDMANINEQKAKKDLDDNKNLPF